MKLSVVHTYQSVRFNKRDETHFTAAKPTMEGMEMEYDEKLLIVRIRIPGVDDVIVFPTNIAYAVVVEDAKPEPKLKKA